MSKAYYQRPANSYPRITLHCNQCGNEFNIAVTRFGERSPVDCQVCGQVFPEHLGEPFYKALADMFQVKHRLEESGAAFDISFVYKSTFKQPPGPLPFLPEDFDPDKDQ